MLLSRGNSHLLIDKTQDIHTTVASSSDINVHHTPVKHACYAIAIHAPTGTTVWFGVSRMCGNGVSGVGCSQFFASYSA